MEKEANLLICNAEAQNMIQISPETELIVPPIELHRPTKLHKNMYE